jgi:protein gp37
MLESWARDLKNECVASKVPFFFKQKYIGTKKFSMPLLDGQVWDQVPELNHTK